MTYDYPSYYGSFRCIGGSCKDSCCIGWEVDIDEDTWDYYQTVKGPFGDRLRTHMRNDGQDRYFPMCKDGRCPFLNQENLCDIITELGEESLSQVCTEYPRYFLEEGNFVQIDLSLSCMELGRIFFEGDEPIEYIREQMPDPDKGAYDAPEETDSPDNNVSDAPEGTDSPDKGAYDAPEGTDSPDKGAYDLLEETDSPDEISGDIPSPLLAEILDIRDDCIGIMEDRQTPLKDRFAEVLRLYGPKAEAAADCPDDLNGEAEGLTGASTWQAEDLSGLLDLMGRMEVLDDRWTGQLDEIRTQAAGIAKLDSEIHRQIPAPGSHNSYDTVDKFSQVWFEKLGCYFLFRYVTDAYFTEKASGAAHPGAGVAASVRFCARSIRFIWYMCLSRYLKNGRKFTANDMIDLAHLYSKQVEHSDENVDFLKT